MTKHYSPNISEDALRILNSKQGDFLSDEVAGPIINIPLTPVCNVVKDKYSNTSANDVIYTTPTDQDFYLVAVELSVMKDATCDMADGRIYVSVIINGVSTNLCSIPAITTTALVQSKMVTLDKPIKLDRNTAVTNARSGAHTVGKMLRTATIYGYTRSP